MSDITVSLIHATRGRAAQALLCRKQWLMAAEHADQIEHIFGIDEDDCESIKLLSRYSHVIVKTGGGCVQAWNEASKKSTGQVLLQLSDDWLPCKNWDTLIMQRVDDPSREAVLAVSDGYRNDPLLCMAILTRGRYEKQGFMFYEGYKNMYSDFEFTHRAYKDNVVVEARDIVFKHEHPRNTGLEWDETYLQQNAHANYHEGLKLYRERNPDAAPTSFEKEQRYPIENVDKS